jgi:HD-like signal output (HDOD) protein
MQLTAFAPTLLPDKSPREKALAGIGKLPPFSPVLTKLLAMLADDDIMVGELADWVEKDTVLTGNVLRMVNSAAYGRMGTVANVRHAIAMLGLSRVRNIVLSLSVCAAMTPLELPAGWSARHFNLHAVAVANLSDLIAQNTKVAYPDGAFVAGLLHDVGKLLLAVTCPNVYSYVIVETKREGRTFNDVELADLGFSHAELSERVVESWKLPVPVQVAVRYHHDPAAEENVTGLPSLSHVVQVADGCANAMGISAVADGRAAEDPTPLLQALGLGEKSERILQTFHKDMEAMRGIL